MARPLRIQFPGAWYHIMNRGGRGKTVFEDLFDRRGFLRLLGESSQMWNIEIHAYSLLDNHYHLLICTPEANLSRAMRHIDGVYTQRFNKHHDLDGQLFRGRYKSILIDKDNYLLEVIRYIHLQPVRAGLFLNPIEHKWTSHRAFMLKYFCPSWLKINVVLSLFGYEGKEANKELDKFVKKGLPEKIEKFYSRQRLLPILGSEKFEKLIQDKFIKRNRLSYEIPQRKTAGKKPSIDEIVRAVAIEYKLPAKKIMLAARGIPNEPRNLAIYLSRKLGGYKLTEIAACFNLAGYTGVSSTLGRVNKQLLVDKRLRTNLEEIQDLLKSIIVDGKNK